MLDSDGPLLKFVTISNDGFIRMNELDTGSDKAVCKKQFFVSDSGFSNAC